MNTSLVAALGAGVAIPAFGADAFAALLDALGIDRIDVIGESAGATSALQLARRHPERVKHLVVLVGNLPGSPTAVVPTVLGEAIQPATPAVLQPRGHQRTNLDRPHQGRPGRLARGERARGRAIRGARFVSLESGGHLMIGQTRVIRGEVADFFTEQRDRRTERLASSTTQSCHSARSVGGHECSRTA
jgi:pimeloyl-ACP methyl ester carboxylesterase